MILAVARVAPSFLGRGIPGEAEKACCADLAIFLRPWDLFGFFFFTKKRVALFQGPHVFLFLSLEKIWRQEGPICSAPDGIDVPSLFFHWETIPNGCSPLVFVI